MNFYPRSPCGERPPQWKILSRQQHISIHALLAESDHGLYSLVAITPLFLSTLSLRRATTTADKEARKRLISIHALLAESDAGILLDLALHENFYPRSPCGERQGSPYLQIGKQCISIHALLAESDIIMGGPGMMTLPFLSTLSLRRATEAQDEYKDTVTISIHALLAESDHIRSTSSGRRDISIHALLAESDLFQSTPRRQIVAFLSTLSLRRATISRLP